MLSTMRVGGLAQRVAVASSTRTGTAAASPSAALPRKTSRVSLATATSVVGGRPLLRAGAFGGAEYERKPHRAFVRKGAGLHGVADSSQRAMHVLLFANKFRALLSTYHVQ